MKFYQENKVNPFGSCLPLVLQLPVFFSLFYMLRKDLQDRHLRRGDREVAAEHGTTLTNVGCDQVDPGSAQFLFIPDLTAKATGGVAGRPARPLRRLAAALERADVGHGRPQPAHHHDRAAVRLRALRPAASRPACSCTGSPRTSGRSASSTSSGAARDCRCSAAPGQRAGVSRPARRPRSPSKGGGAAEAARSEPKAKREAERQRRRRRARRAARAPRERSAPAATPAAQEEEPGRRR